MGLLAQDSSMKQHVFHKYYFNPMTKYRKHVYCESNFLETCISKTENWKVSGIDFKELEMWICLRSMLFGSDIILHLDIPKDDFVAIAQKKSTDLSYFEKQLRLLFFQQQEGKSILKLTDEFVTLDKIVLSNDQHLTSYFLTCADNEMCEKCMNDYGVMVINPTRIKEFGFVLLDEGVAVSRNEKASWGSILKRFPCNCLALIDNYIFSDETIRHENLKGIFGALLPEKLDLNIPFQIAIITSLKKNHNNEDINSKACYEETATLIGELRPNLYFKLSFFKCNKFHDRSIITNNTYINCAGGFDLIENGKPKKTTTISIAYPYINNSIKWLSNAYSNIIQEATNVTQSATEFRADCLSGFYVGEKRFRLFS